MIIPCVAIPPVLLAPSLPVLLWSGCRRAELARIKLWKPKPGGADWEWCVIGNVCGLGVEVYSSKCENTNGCNAHPNEKNHSLEHSHGGSHCIDSSNAVTLGLLDVSEAFPFSQPGSHAFTKRHIHGFCLRYIPYGKCQPLTNFECYWVEQSLKYWVRLSQMTDSIERMEGPTL